MTDAVQQRIADIANGNDVVLFMKGTPLFPQCGFSSRAIAILEHLGVNYDTVDVLQDQAVRQGIKTFSDWPTIPQLYVKGEFVGGSDIMMEMYEAGELQQLMTDNGVAAANCSPFQGERSWGGPLVGPPFLLCAGERGTGWGMPAETMPASPRVVERWVCIKTFNRRATRAEARKTAWDEG